MLQFTIVEVKSEVIEVQLYPSYRIPFKDIPLLPNFSTEATRCINSYRYVKYGNTFYLAVNIIDDEFIYAENCVLDDEEVYPRKSIIFKLEDDLMVLHGCFIIYDEIFNGTLILMRETWKIGFLHNGLTYFNISPTHTIDIEKHLINESSNLTYYPYPEKCNDFKSSTKLCMNGFSRIGDKSVFILFYIFFFVGILMVAAAVSAFWYR